MRLLNRFFLLFFISFQTVFFSVSFAQKGKDQLEKEKKLIQSQIKETQQILDQTASKKKASIGQLNALKGQINSYSKLINNYAAEVKMLDVKINEDSEVIRALSSDLENLKNEYGHMVYAMYKSSGGFNRLSFIFASSNLSQFYMRFKYLEQYTSARKNQVKLIGEIKTEIEKEVATLEKTKVEKDALLAQQIKEKEKLDELRMQQDKVLASLKSEESKLLAEIKTKNGEILKLENLIAKLLKEEISKSAGNTTISAEAKIDLNNISSLFEKSKSSLPWPVSSGFISGKFGTHPHPVLTRVKVPNDGVNIQTKQNEQVKAVFEGIVKKIAIVPGEFKYVVIVQHGSYFTVYAKLKQVNVKMGQQVTKEDVIGEVNTDGNGISELQFQVWKNTQKLDPELWLAKR
jgi:murein hydrolase activator